MRFKITNKPNSDYYERDSYICTVDLEQKNKRNVGGVELTILNHLTNNHRGTHPNIGEIVESSENSQFKKGQKVLCKHFAFTDQCREPKDFFEDVYGTRFYHINNFDVMFGIDGDKLVPREGVLLCEYIEDKFVETPFYVTGDNEGKRRDVVKVVQTWRDCSEYQTGDYIFVAYGGDYEFEFNGKSYVKVDHYFNDVIAKVPSPEWRDKFIRKHIKHNVSY